MTATTASARVLQGQSGCRTATSAFSICLQPLALPFLPRFRRPFHQTILYAKAGDGFSVGPSVAAVFIFKTALGLQQASRPLRAIAPLSRLVPPAGRARCRGEAILRLLRGGRGAAGQEGRSPGAGKPGGARRGSGRAAGTAGQRGSAEGLRGSEKEHPRRPATPGRPPRRGRAGRERCAAPQAAGAAEPSPVSSPPGPGGTGAAEAGAPRRAGKAGGAAPGNMEGGAERAGP